VSHVAQDFVTAKDLDQSSDDSKANIDYTPQDLRAKLRNLRRKRNKIEAAMIIVKHGGHIGQEESDMLSEKESILSQLGKLEKLLRFEPC